MTDPGPDKPQDGELPPDGETPAEPGNAHAQTPDPGAPTPAPAPEPADATSEDAYADDSADRAPAEDSAPAEPSDSTTSEGGDSDDSSTDDWNSGHDDHDEWNEGQYDDWGDGFNGEGWRDDDTPDDGYDDHYQDYDYETDTELTTWQDDNEPARPDPAGGSDKTPAKAGGGAVATAGEDDEEEGPDDAELARSTMSLGDHLDELRVRLIKALVGLGIAMVGTCFFGKQILRVLQDSYFVAMEANGLKPEMIITGVHEGFLTYFKISLIAGMVLASPWVFYQIWQFIAAGLYRKERRYVTVAVPFSATLFICGSAFFLFVVSKPMLMFFVGFSKWMGVTPMIKLKEYVGFITMLMLVFGLAFQTPLVVFLLGKMGLVSLTTLRKYRRHVIVVFLILAAVATSPSPVDQIMLALPMYLLYEMGVLMLAISEKKRREREAADEEEDRLRSEELARERGEDN